MITSAPVRAWRTGRSTTSLTTDRGSIEARTVLVTAGAWTPEFENHLQIHCPIVPVRGQMVASTPVPKLLNGPVMRPHTYLQSTDGRFIGGGTMESAGFNRDPNPELERQIWAEACRLLPALRDARITHSWARHRPGTRDQLPLVGFCGPGGRHLVAAGHYKNGVLLACVTGKVISELVTRGHTRFEVDGWSPHRFLPGNG
jgi:glycine oxidase